MAAVARRAVDPKDSIRYENLERNGLRERRSLGDRNDETKAGSNEKAILNIDVLLAAVAERDASELGVLIQPPQTT